MTEESSAAAAVEVVADPVGQVAVMNEDGEWKVHWMIVGPST